MITNFKFGIFYIRVFIVFSIRIRFNINCFHFKQEINQRKKLSKYIAAFVFKNKVLIVFSATSGRLSMISFIPVVGAPVGTASTSFTLIFSLTTGKVNSSTTRNKKKIYDKILMLAKSKLNSTETLVSQAN